MISLIERTLGKKMDREATPATFASSWTEEVPEEKSDNFSRQTPRGKKPAGATHGKSRRSKACSFNFGTGKAVPR
jgi:hypothetical protein